MIAIGTRANADRRRRAVPALGTIFHRAEWMESGDDPQLSPTIFMVEQPPHTTLVPHFHRNNQFQLFVEGSGTIGPHPVGPAMVHYAGAYTGYGPLVSGAEGIKYLTIRPVQESGFIPIVERDKMVRGPKRHASSERFGVRSGNQPMAAGEPQVHTLIAQGADGLAANVTRLPPGARYTAEATAGSQGQFLVLTGGVLRYGDIDLGVWESLWISADEPPLELMAGDTGAEVVAMHVPPKDAAYL